MSSLSEWARYAPSDDFWLASGLLVVLAIGGFLGAFYYFARKRVVEDTPTSKIRSAAQGYVEFIGHGELMEGTPILAPLTKRNCTWYSYKVEERRQSGKNSKWVKVEGDTSDELFLIIDESGQCVIDPEGASVTASEKNVWYGNTVWPDRGYKSGGLFSGGRYRYTEERMHPKDQLFALGLFNTVGGAGGEFNIDDDVRALLKEWKQDSEALLKKYDKNKDGQIDMEEWQAVRQDALNHAMANHAERKTAPPVNMMTKTCDRRRPYLLSAVSQEALIKRYHFFSIGLISLFFICGAFATWFISLRMTGA